MKIKFKKILIILTLVILSITGCSSNTNDNNKSGNSKDKEDSIKVVTSFYPMSDYMDESHNHDHGHDHDEEYNPHVWLSVENAIKQVENIENKLIEYNSINKDKYSQNAREYIEQLSNLDNKIHSELDNIKNKNIVTFHEAFPYFAKEYGLNIVGVVQREAGSEPSAKELRN